MTNKNTLLYKYNPVEGKELYSKLKMDFPIFSSTNGSKHSVELENPIHGRSICLGEIDYQNSKRWLFAKGIGWTKQFTEFLFVDKDIEYYMGLQNIEECLREWEVSESLNRYKFWKGDVLAGYEYDYLFLNGEKIPADEITYNGEQPFRPCMTYYCSRSRYRVFDVAYMTDEKRSQHLEWLIITSQSKTVKEYMEWFIDRTAYNVALLHKLGGVDDSLSSHNVTTLGEKIDFELVYVPEVPHKESSWNDNIYRRQNKEILYAFDLIIDLIAFFHVDFNWIISKDLFIKKYEEYYPNHDRESLFRKLNFKR
mgnify:CR=1 FL=1